MGGRGRTLRNCGGPANLANLAALANLANLAGLANLANLANFADLVNLASLGNPGEYSDALIFWAITARSSINFAPWSYVCSF